MTASFRTVTRQIRPRRPGGCLGALIALAIVVFAGVMITILVALAIWPGEVKLVAPLFCTDDQPDAFVVTDTYSVRPGETTTNYTLYCMGPDGDASDKGFMLPFAATAGLNTLVLIAIVVVARLVGRLRRGSGAASADSDATDTDDEPITGPATTAGPFVD